MTMMHRKKTHAPNHNRFAISYLFISHMTLSLSLSFSVCLLCRFILPLDRCLLLLFIREDGYNIHVHDAEQNKLASPHNQHQTSSQYGWIAQYLRGQPQTIVSSDMTIPDVLSSRRILIIINSPYIHKTCQVLVIIDRSDINLILFSSSKSTTKEAREKSIAIAKSDQNKFH